MDDAIDSLIDPSTSANNTTEENEYKRWKRSELHAKKGSNHANNPTKYWVELRDRYPNLKLALDVLFILASSCECERLFSKLGDLLEPCRRAIRPQLLAAIECLRRWQKAGLGDAELAAKVAITGDEIKLLYDFKSWGGDSHNS
jgi:hypothetical protein